MPGSDLDAAIRARLDAGRMIVYGGRQVEAPSSLALRAVLDKAKTWETGIDGPSTVGRAFADEVRRVIADKLGVEVPRDR